MTVQPRFTLPAADESREAHELALAALNSIKLRDRHIRHGFGFLIAADFDEPGAAASRLLAYASAEGLYPADVAAQAIAIRVGWLWNFIEAGGDPEVDWAYGAFASDRINLRDLGWTDEPKDGEPLDDENPW